MNKLDLNYTEINRIIVALKFSKNYADKDQLELYDNLIKKLEYFQYQKRKI